MKDFNDLFFEPHELLQHFKAQARMDFENGYGVSVITGYGAYGNETRPYEVAVMFEGELCYTTPITDDVIGYQTAEDVSDIMKQVQEL